MLHVHNAIQALKNGHDKGDDDKLTNAFIHQLTTATKYDLGEYTPHNKATFETLLTTGYELLDHGLYVLPSPHTYMEMRTQIDSDTLWMLGVYSTAVDNDHPARSLPILKGVVGDVVLHTIVTQMDSEDNRKCYGIMGHVVITNALGECWTMPLEDVEDTVTAQQNATAMVRTVLAVGSAALCAKGVQFPRETVSAKLNKRREAVGKVPLFEHYTLKIGRVSSGGGILRAGGERASPRAHDRRGHVRVLNRGGKNERIIVIPACFVGGAGRISKDYEVVT
jgi:hypothetical protein